VDHDYNASPLLVIHLLSDLSKDAHGVEYEGERTRTLALGSESVGGVCVSFTRT